jgi:hypothetical protein
MEKHVTILGALYIAFSSMGLLAALIVFVSVAGGGLLSGDLEAIAITATVGSVIAGFLTLVSLPGLIGGIGLLGMRPWSRLLTLIISFLNLLNIPFGTALGIYGIWVLSKDECASLFAGARA